jgi:hypothetical protein
MNAKVELFGQRLGFAIELRCIPEFACIRSKYVGIDKKKGHHQLYKFEQKQKRIIFFK